MKFIYKSIFVASLLVAFGCNDDFDNLVEEYNPTSGTADFSKYVAIGNSLTSGYQDNALYSTGQRYSYPALLANQMSLAGGGEFSQPLMPDDIGGFTDLGIPGKLVLQYVNGAPSPVPLPAQASFSSTFVQGEFNNMGVPGAKSYHLLAPGYGNPAGIEAGLANPYFARFASSPSTSIMQDVLMQQPTFFTMWIGSNDVLSFATSGGIGTNQSGNVDPSTYGSYDLSDPNMVGGVINGILEQLVVEGGAKGAIANIPYVTSIPFFTTVPAKPLSPENTNYAAQITTLNSSYENLNLVFDAIGQPERKVTFDEAGASGLVFVDDSLPDLSAQIAAVLTASGYPASQAQLLGMIFGQTRQSGEGDLIPLTMSSQIGKLDENRVAELMQMGLSQEQAGQLSIIGLTYPKDEWVLSADEVAQVIETTDGINASIETLAGNYQLAFVDMNENMSILDSGIQYNGVTYNTSFISGGAFSLDGVHLTSKGYAFICNYFMEAINAKYGSNLREVDANNYPGVQFP